MDGEEIFWERNKHWILLFLKIGICGEGMNKTYLFFLKNRFFEKKNTEILHQVSDAFVTTVCHFEGLHKMSHWT